MLLNFEMTVDSHEVEKIMQRDPMDPLSSFPQMVTSYETLMQYHNQIINTNTVKTQDIFNTIRIPLVALL